MDDEDQNPYQTAIDALPAPAATKPAAAPATPEVNPYDAAMDQLAAGRTQTLRVSMAQAADQSPEKAADILRLSNTLNVAPSIVERNYDDIKKRAQLSDTPYSRMVRETPAVAAFVAKSPYHAAVAQDDLPALTTLEQTLRMGANAFRALGAGALDFSQGLYGALQAGADLADHMLLAPRGAAPGQLTAGTVDLYAQPKVRNADGSVSTVDSLSVNIDGKEVLLPTVTPDGRHFQGTDQERTAQAIAEYQQTGRHLGIFDSPASATAYAKQLHEDYAAGVYDQRGIAARVSGFARAAASEAGAEASIVRGPQTGAGFVERNIYGGIEGVGQMTPALVAGVFGGAAALLGTVGLSTAGQAYTQSRAEGLTPGRSGTYAGLAGAIAVGTQLIPAHLLLGDLASNATLVKTLTHQALSMIPTQEVQTALDDLNQWAFLPSNKEKTFADYLGARGTQAAASLIGALVAFAPHTIIGHASAHLMDRLGAATQESKTVARMPDAVTEIASQATDGSPVDTVYLPIDTFTQYWQSKGEDPATVARRVTGDPAAFTRATASGEDLAVPMGRYAAEIAPTEHNAYFAQEARIAPDQMNGREVQQFYADLKQQDTQQQADVEAQQREAAAKPVRDAITSQLEGAGFDRSVAASYATLYEQTFQTLGERAGLDPTALFEQYGLTIERPELQGEAQPGETQLNQQPRPEFVPVGGEASENADRRAATTADDQSIETLAQTGEADPQKATLREMRREPGAGPVRVLYQPPTETPAFRKWFGDSKVVDETGKPRVAYHGTDQNFDTFDLEKTGGGRGSKEEKALFFSLTPTVANESAEIMGAQEGGAYKGSVVYPVYLKLENPAVSEMRFYNSREMEQEIKAARAAGHDGIVFPQLNQIGEQDTVAVFSPNQVKSALGNKGTFDPNNPSILNQDVRGSIRIGPNQQMKIELLRKADLSTFFHETGHFFLEVLHDLGNRADAAPGIKADLATLDTWLTDEDHTGAGYSVKQHEQFARGFEAYLMEGKAPSAELRTVFARFRAWLVGTYRSLKNLNVELTPEVRGVFDRLVASDDAIAHAEAEGHVAPLFTDAKMAGMSEDAFSAYKATVQAASDRARDDLQAKLLGTLQREQQAWWKRERETMRTQVAGELGEQPVFRALAAIQKGTHPDGTPLVDGEAPKPLKLAKADLVDHYTPDQLAELRRRRVYSAEGGAHPDDVAPLVGFSSGDELVHALLAAPSMNAAVDAETDRRMTATHGDLLTDGHLQEQAKAAVFGEHRETVIRAELRALSAARRQAAPAVRLAERETAGRKQVEIDALRTDVSDLKAQARSGAATIRAALPSAEVIRTHAEQRAAGTLVRDLRPGQLLAAAQRASREATESAARQEFDRAIQAKQKELVNLAVYREVVKARDAVQATVDYLKSFDAAATRERIGKAGGDYLEMIDGLRDRYELATVTLKDLDRRKSLAAFIASEQAKGNELAIPLELQNDLRRVNYKDATVEELRGLREAVTSIAHVAGLKNRLLRRAAQRDLDVLATDGAASIDANKVGGPRTVATEPRLPGTSGRRDVRGWIIAHRPMLALVREMDGFKDGFLFDHLWRPVHESRNAEGVTGRAAAQELARIQDERFKGEEHTLYEQRYIPAIDTSLSTAARIVVALNYGNDGNRERLLSGGIGNSGPLTDAKVRAILDTLTPRDWTYVKDVTTLINSYRDQIGALYKRVTGVEPTWVEPTPFQTAHGEQPGGYYPIMYEGRASARALPGPEASFADIVGKSSYMRFQTANGHTEARAQSTGTPLRADLGVIGEHLQQVIHDLTHREMLIDAGRFLGRKEVQDAIYRNYGDQHYTELKGAFRDIAIGTMPAPAWYRVLAPLRRGYSVARLAWNFATMVRHVTNLTSGMVRVGEAEVLKAIPQWLGSGKDAEFSSSWIATNSDLMGARWNHRMEELASINNEIGLNRGKWAATLRDAAASVGVDPDVTHRMSDSYLYGIHKIIQMAEIPTWIAAYQQAIPDGDHARAVAVADNAVLDAFGGGDIMDRAGVQRSDAGRLFTTFMSYGLTLNRQNFEIFHKDTSIGRKMVDASLLNIVPVLFLSAIFHQLHSKTSYTQEVAEELFAHATGMFVFARELAGALRSPDYSGPSATAPIGTVTRLIYNTAQTLKAPTTEKATEKAKAVAKGAAELGGQFYGVPVFQIEKTAQGIQALSEGKTKDPSAVVFGPPKESR